MSIREVEYQISFTSICGHESELAATESSEHRIRREGQQTPCADCEAGIRMLRALEAYDQWEAVEWGWMWIQGMIAATDGRREMLMRFVRAVPPIVITSN